MRYCIQYRIRYLDFLSYIKLHLRYRIHPTYDIAYDILKTYDIVGFYLRYRRFLDCSCHLHLRCRMS